MEFLFVFHFTTKEKYDVKTNFECLYICNDFFRFLVF